MFIVYTHVVLNKHYVLLCSEDKFNYWK